MVLHNPGHWVNKNAIEWTKDYFNQHLPGISGEESGASAKIDRVLDVEGDVEVSQRKGKVISIFDVKVRLEYSGKTADGTEVSGTITIPEVAHDTAEDEYVFEISNYSDTKEKQPVRDVVRNKLAPQLRAAFQTFGRELIVEHGKDLQHPDGAPPGIKPLPPTTKVMPSSTKPSSSSTTSSAASSAIPTSSTRVVNTVTLTENYEFQTSADQLYQTFTDPQRVAAFTRAPIQTFQPEVNGEFSLFAGNVQGRFLVLEKDKKIEQLWRLSTWPEGHFSKQELVFDQGTAGTTVRMRWEGVPVGEDEMAKKRFGENYVRAIMTTFGFGAVL